MPNFAAQKTLAVFRRAPEAFENRPIFDEAELVTLNLFTALDTQAEHSGFRVQPRSIPVETLKATITHRPISR